VLVGIEPYYDIMVVDPLIYNWDCTSKWGFWGAGNKCFGNGETNCQFFAPLKEVQI
jgi:hypothetical protein